MDEYPNLRRLLNLKGLSSKDDPKLAERLDDFQKRSADDILDIAVCRPCGIAFYNLSNIN